MLQPTPVANIGAIDRVVHEAKMGMQDGVIDVICRLTAVCPDEGDDRTNDEQQGVVEQKFPGSFHAPT